MARTDRSRGLFCNRTLNLRAVKAVGYDMDYTLIHYRMEEWERHAYGYLKRGLAAGGWPVDALEFVPDLVMRGLILDVELGNVVKANRFGYVKRAYHGTRPMDYDAQREVYARTPVDLRERRWVFLNTLFSISEACMYMQLVDLLDAGKLSGAMGYDELYQRVRQTLDEAHLEGELKAEILANPGRYVEPDPEMPLALLDQKEAGKRLLLITNSEWGYAAPMLSFAVDPHLPDGMTWRELFDVALLGARKPDFFSVRMPAFEVVDDSGLLREHVGPLRTGHAYVGGNAGLVEESLGLSGEEILYVGDHIFVDVNVSKSVHRWRTALVLRELEGEIRAVERFAGSQRAFSELMAEKTRLEDEFDHRRLLIQRLRHGRGDAERTEAGLEAEMARLRERMLELDQRIAPLAVASGELLNPNWGLLMRAGNDKSHLARQVERYADVYTSRVSNFLHHTPFVYLRSPRGSLPHDPGP